MLELNQLFYILHSTPGFPTFESRRGGRKEKKKGKIQTWLFEKQQEMERKGSGEEKNHSVGKKANFLNLLRKVLYFSSITTPFIPEL